MAHGHIVVGEASICFTQVTLKYTRF